MNKSGNSVLLLMLAVLLAGPLAGCSNLGYYAQAMGGHLDVMRATQPIGDVVRDPASNPELRKNLADVLAIREFASRELGLPDNNSYRTYADVGRPFVVWNVFAAPEFSLEPQRWCMLMVGCVNYRGYYDRQDAERLAADLRQEGYDTFVGGVSAYSTLGYFDDPVLSSFLRLGTPEVARTVFHELAHQLVFVEGDSLFNESFATAVENEGMRRWLASRAVPGQHTVFEAQRERKVAFAGLMRDYRKKFRALYASARATDQQRHAKAELLDALRSDYADLKAGWGGYAGYDKFFSEDLNNAKLASLALYSELVPAFEALLEEENHDLPRFYQRVVALAALGKESRRGELTRLLPASGDIRQARGGTAVEVAAGYPTESQFRQALNDIAGLVRAEGMELKVLDAQKEGLASPLLAAGLDIGANTCVVFFNTRPEDGLTQFFAGFGEGDMPQLMRALSVHEVTHCVEQREAYVRQRFDKVLPDDYQHDDMTVEGYVSVVKSGVVETWGEALGDISSLLYLKQAMPGRWQGMARRISAMRHELAHKWPQHDTSAWLDRLIKANPDIGDGANLFDAAFQYRRQFRPG